MSRRLLLAVFTAATLLFPASLRAEDVYCEVMSVEGTATLSNATVSGKDLREGDLLSADDVVQVGEGSFVDLAYDRDWKNVTRVEENSSVRIRSLLPAEVELQSGGIFAKLKSLPKDSTFDVQTPTAIATVRGTEYRTTYLEGETQVYNVSDSDVYVYGLDDSGQKQEAEPVIVRNSQKTFVPHRGEAPKAPQRMESSDIQRAAGARQGIERNIQRNVERGRVGKLPDVGELGRRMQERQQNGEGRRSEGPGKPGNENSGPGQERSAERRGDMGEGRPQREVQGQGERQDGGRPQGGLGEPFFPGGERQRRDAGPANGPDGEGSGMRRENNQGMGQQKPGPARPAARPRAQR